MIQFDGISFSEPISRRIMAELVRHNPTYSDLAPDELIDQVSRFSFMSALAKLSGLAFFPRVAEFSESDLLRSCNAAVLARGFFTPLCREGQDTLVVAVANPWSELPEAYVALLFPDLEIVRIVTLASEITRSIEAAACHTAIRVAEPGPHAPHNGSAMRRERSGYVAF